MELPGCTALLRRVALRMRIVSFGERLCRSLLVLCGVYAVGLLVSRLAGVAIEWFTTPDIAVAIPAAALLLGLLLHRRPKPADVARIVDRHGGTKDLFLTVALLENSAGEYQPLVVSSAEEKAAKVAPAAVVPFRCGVPLASSLGAAFVLLVLGFLYLPQFDPFGKVEAAEQVQQRHEKLAETKKATEVRAAQLKSEGNEGEESPEVKKAIENLKASFKKMEPKAKQENFKLLAANQKNLGELWRKVNAEKLKDLLTKAPQEQQFGAGDKDKLQKWTRELQEGSTDSLRKELDEIKDDIEKLAKTQDPVKKAELEQKLKKRLKELQEFASEKANSKPLTAALERAMKQLDMAKMDGLQTESLEAMNKSLDLTKLELKEIAQSAKDLQALEEALKVVQMAKRLNEQEKLDGERGEGLFTLEDYEELYKEMMAQMGEMGDGDGEGDGDGLGGEGIGRGGKAPEDDAAKTGFKTEQSKSAVTVGKVLLSLKTKGLSDRGDAKKDYAGLVKSVKQGVSEAILQEQIPPGYVEGIQNYFDTLEKTNAGEKK